MWFSADVVGYFHNKINEKVLTQQSLNIVFSRTTCYKNWVTIIAKRSQCKNNQTGINKVISKAEVTVLLTRFYLFLL